LTVPTRKVRFNLAVSDTESDEEDEPGDEWDYWDEQFHLAQFEDNNWHAFNSLARFLLIEIFEALRFSVTGILSYSGGTK
jgi:hypothetical protein